MKRFALNGAALVSLLFFVIVAVAWVRARFVRDELMYTWPSGRVILQSVPGKVGVTAALGGHWGEEDSPGLSFRQDDAALDGRQPVTEVLGVAGRIEANRSGLGFDYLRCSTGAFAYARSWHVMQAPTAALLGAFAVLPVWAVVSDRRRRKRRRAGACPACGYDLTGNVSGVCPECGTRRS